MSDERGVDGRVGELINDARRSHLRGRLITSWPDPSMGRGMKKGRWWGGESTSNQYGAHQYIAPNSMPKMAPASMADHPAHKWSPITMASIRMASITL